MADVPPFLWADSGTFDSPKTYTVPGSGEVQPYTATATYDNASGQAILPALRIKSAAGNLLALVFPAGQIADGDSSEVTFVPPFGSAASDTSGIRFDFPNRGDWLAITTNGAAPLSGDGFLLSTFGGGGVEILSGDFLTLSSQQDGLTIQNMDTSVPMEILSDGGLTLQDTSSSTTTLENTGGGDVGITTSGGGVIRVASAGTLALSSAHTGGGLVAVPIRIHAGDLVAVEDLDNSLAFLFTIGTDGVNAFLSTGKAFQIHDHTGAVILQVHDTGPAYRIKTGHAWVADL